MTTPLRPVAAARVSLLAARRCSALRRAWHAALCAPCLRRTGVKWGAPWRRFPQDRGETFAPPCVRCTCTPRGWGARTEAPTGGSCCERHHHAPVAGGGCASAGRRPQRDNCGAPHRVPGAQQRRRLRRRQAAAHRTVVAAFAAQRGRSEPQLPLPTRPGRAPVAVGTAPPMRACVPRPLRSAPLPVHAACLWLCRRA